MRRTNDTFQELNVAIAIISGVTVGLIGLAAGWRMGYGVGHLDGQTGWWSPWPWSQTRKSEEV